MTADAPAGAAGADRIKFVIYAPSFNDAAGGTISLHLLCHRLAEFGLDARLWPSHPSLLDPRHTLRERLYWLKERLRIAITGYDTGPFPNKVARRRRDLDGAIVVYPEVISGNPLRARHVVRWLLHRPGNFTGKFDYGRDDLIFFYQIAFNDPALGLPADHKLTLVWINELYRDLGATVRTGNCYLLRKGKGRELVHDLTDSTFLDDLGHEEKTAVFNRTRFFYSYDTYTMYALYAAICGCVPIIVPEPGMTKFDWAKEPEDRYGIAYGEDEIPWAIETRPKLLARLRDKQLEEDAMVASFVRKCRARFEPGG